MEALIVKPYDAFGKRYGFLLHVMMAQMSSKKGPEKFGERATDAIIEEFQQLHEKYVFVPRYFTDLTSEQRRKSIHAIKLVNEKKSGKIKGRTVADSRSQRAYTDPEDTASPTVSLEVLMLTCVIEAEEERGVTTSDVSGDFPQADMDAFVTGVFTGSMVDLLIGADVAYMKFVYVTKRGEKVIYIYN